MSKLTLDPALNLTHFTIRFGYGVSGKKQQRRVKEWISIKIFQDFGHENISKLVY